MAKQWLIWSKNIGPKLKSKTKNIVMPDKFMVGVQVTLDDELFEKLEVNPVWLARAQEAAGKQADVLVQKAVVLLQKADAQFDKLKTETERAKMTAKAEKALDTCLVKVTDMSESVNKANERAETYEKALDGMEKGIPGWAKWIDVALGLTIDLATGITDANSTFEKAISAIGSIENTIGNEVMERV